jgi:hypothetical protein
MAGPPNCGSADHWAYECPDLASEQQAQLHMTMKPNTIVDKLNKKRGINS